MEAPLAAMVRRIVFGLALAAFIAVSRPAAAQDRSFIRTLWGDAQPTTIYIDMWVNHLLGGFPPLQHDEYFGATVDGWHGATFLNSRRGRCWTGGVERNWGSWQPNGWRASLGYRLGLLYGYDGRMLPLAAKTPILIAPEILFDLDYRRVGIQVGYAGVVVTVGFIVRIGDGS